ncbi:MBL fold metallo-hydrolase [Sessilibacter sp. MAH4]
MHFNQNAKKPLLTLASLLLTTNATWVCAQDDAPKVESEKVTDSIYMITGRGGNVGLFIGDETTILIDDKFAPLSEVITQEVASITKTPIEYLLNTHYHGDHTGGNVNFGKAGTTIVAHDNVRKILASGGEIKAFNSKFEPLEKAGLPSITFNDKISFHVNGETVTLEHYPNAHTDGDGVVFFEEQNVVHTGDIFFNGRYPFIDIGNGGSVQGTIAAIDKITAKINDSTKVIAGHGPQGNKKAMIAYRDMLEKSLAIVAELKNQGLSMDEVKAKLPLAELDKTWGEGGMKPEVWVTIVYSSLD